MEQVKQFADLLCSAAENDGAIAKGLKAVASGEPLTDIHPQTLNDILQWLNDYEQIIHGDLEIRMAMSDPAEYEVDNMENFDDMLFTIEERIGRFLSVFDFDNFQED